MRHLVTIETGAIARFYRTSRRGSDIAAIAADLDRRLAARKAMRTARSNAAVKGWHTRRNNSQSKG